MSGKRLDILVLLFLLILGVVYAEISHATVFGTAVLSASVTFVPSIIYLGVRKKKNWKKVIVSTLLFGGMFGFFFEFLSEYNHSYTVISHLSPKIFGVLPLDNVIGHMLMTMLTVVFYEHFVDREVNPHLSKNLKYALLPAIFVLTGMLILFILQPKALLFPYQYFFMGIIAVLPPLFLGITRPQFIKNMALTAIYFFFLYLVFEVTAVRYSWWIYPGTTYIGWVRVGNLQFPFEELFFWMIFYAASLVSYYELFIDDHTLLKRKKKRRLR